MSPHAALPTWADTTEFLHKYSITKNGFLPAEAPLKILPDAYYAPWERIIQHLPELLSTRKLRLYVDQLSVLSTNRLSTEAEWRRAYVILTFLTHGYIWGGVKAKDILPPAITVPLLDVSKHLELPPVATYAALNLWNYSSAGSDLTNLDELEVLHTFTGTRDEAWFYLVSVAMEAEGGRIVSTMAKALNSIKTHDYTVITECLELLSENIRIIGILLERMYEHCDPAVFFYQIRPYLAGSMNMAAAGLPNGVFYDEGDGKGKWQQFRGGSNGQSSLIQFLDIVLGIEHNSHGGPLTKDGAPPRRQKEPAFHDEVRNYMPGPHRRFLEHIRYLGSIRELAMQPPPTDEQQRLREAYQAATRAMTDFRNKHLKIVTRYIVRPSMEGKGKRGVNSIKTDLASASTENSEESQLTGTGGTSLMGFLKQTRNETLQAGCLGTRP